MPATLSMDSKVLLPLLGLVGLACDSSDGVVQAGNMSTPALGPAGSFDPRVEPTRVLRGYSWDGVGEVPWLAESAPTELVFGELGRTAQTGLYCTFNGELVREGALQPEGWKLEARGAEAGPGRFGGGLRLGKESLLEVSLGPETRELQAWTIEFWLSPVALARRDLLELPGLLRMYLDGENRLVVDLPGAQPPGPNGSTTLGLRNPTVLEAGTWHHVGLVLDRSEARGVRLVVDGVPHGTKFDPALVNALPERLLLGDVRGRANGLECALDELRFLARNSSTAELAEHARLPREVVERMQLRYATGAEELELWTAPQAEARLDAPEEWARGELTHAFASPAGLTSSPEHWELLPCPNRPVARTTHPFVPIGDQRVFTFGGETRDTHWGSGPNTDDTWIFDGKTHDWTRVAGEGGPSPRCHMPVAYSPDHDIVLLMGGWWQGGWWQGAPPKARLADTWVFHVAEERWEQRVTQGLGKTGLSDHGLVYLPAQRRFLLLQAGNARFYDPESNLWGGEGKFEVVNEGEPIRIPSCYSVALDPSSGNVLLFGGSHGEGTEQEFVDMTALYDPGTNRLTVLSPARSPAARVRPALAWDPVRERFVLFGGVRDQRSERFGDLWTFDPRTQEWSEVPREARRPDARGGYFGMAYDEVEDHFVVSGGRKGFESWSDETWTLSLDERAEGRARYVFDRATFGEGLAWFAEYEARGDSALRFRFRGSSDGMRFGEWSEACPDGERFVQVELTLVPGTDGARPLVRAMGFRAPT